MENIIDLEIFRKKGSKVFTGRDRGISVRNKSQIDVFSEGDFLIKILIPKDIMSINPSFLEEFLSNVVLKLGKDEFYKRITFHSESRYDITLDLEEAIERIIRENTIKNLYEKKI